MPFIPHTDQDIEEMLNTIGVKKIDDLFDEIPNSLRHAPFENMLPGISEMELGKLMRDRAGQDADLLCFIGAGAYEHHIPAAVWNIAERGEYMTAYTPYQAEASQGNLQLIYEFQSMIASLMGMEVANASLYDGGSALAEAILMAMRLAGKLNKTAVLMPRNVHPYYRDTVKTIVEQQRIEILEVPYDKSTGRLRITDLEEKLTASVGALVIPQPNFFGIIEEVDELTEWARKKQLLTIAVVNPIAMALLKPPGDWGEKGADIACGEGQPLGIPLASGGPYYGFLCCRKAHVRQMPGRIVGRTVDKQGREGFVLTLQAREQHIRRGKATSNICTNQGLMVTASTIYMSLLGPQGLRQVALQSHANTHQFLEQVIALPAVSKVFNAHYFHEIVLRFAYPVKTLLQELALHKIQGGYDLGQTYPELNNCLLINITETKSKEEIDRFIHFLKCTLERNKLACQA